MVTKSRKSSSLVNPRVGMVSLGCSKALVDSERILTQLKIEGYEITPDYDGADVVIVNTCGFLDSAREESLDAIGEAMAENGKVIVTGCLGAEPDVIKSRHPGVFDITGPHQYETVVAAVHRAVPPKHDPFVDLVPAQGIKLTPRHYAYLKISEGCNNRCSFCIIPKLRGDLISRPLAEVMREAETLAKSGVKELLVVSQDTSAYGIDVRYAESKWRDQTYRTKFYDLCSALGELGIWVRLHYVYPYPHVDEVLPLMASGKILPYLDIPFQHAAPNVLRAMKRPAASEKVLDRIAAWRKICPDMTVRSTFIVGFPGETEDDFQILLDWMESAQIDRAGCFKYENVVHAASGALDNHVSEDIKQDRWNRFMELQQRISAKKLQSKIGQTIDAIVDESGPDGVVGRSKYDAPDVDGKLFIAGKKRVLPGHIGRVKITGADEYDLHGEWA